MPVEVLSSLTLTLLHTDRVRLDKRWRYDHVISPFSRLYIVTEGEGWVFHNGHRYTLKPNYVYLIPSYSLSQYHCESYLEQTYVHFLEEMEGGYSVFTTLPLHFEVQATQLDHLLFAQLVGLHPDRKLSKTDPKAYDNRSRLLSFNQDQMAPHRLLETHGILLQLLSRFIDAGTILTQPLLKFSQLTATLTYIHQHLTEPLSIDYLAQRRRLTPDYFSRQFKQVMGLSPSQYIIRKRLEQAQRLLATADLSITEIGGQVGIPNPYYFTRLFTRLFGVSPGKYRKTTWQV